MLPKKLKKTIKKYYFLIGIVIFVFFILKTDTKQYFEIFSHDIKFSYLIMATLLTGAILIIKAYRWNYLKRQQNINYNFWNSFLIYSIGVGFGSVTPGKLGDLIKVVYLKKDGYPIKKCLVNVIFDRIFDLVFLFIIGCFSLVFFIVNFGYNIFFFFSTFTLSLLIVLFFVKTQSARKLIKKAFYLIIPRNKQELWILSFKDFLGEIRMFKIPVYFKVTILTIFSWIVFYLQAYFIALSLSMPISFFYLAAALTISLLVSMVPISISGIGTREAVLILLFSNLNIRPEKIISLSILILIISFFASFIGLVSWILKRQLKFT